MNKSKLKSYAPQARRDFIAAVTARANLLGLSDSGGKLEVAIGERKGDIAIIAGQEWPAKVYELRERLIKRMTTEGFSHTVDAIAYTWFNRFAALRYMEIHDYLDHGYRALSNREGGMPEILNHATELDLPGLNKDRAVELKLAGDKDGELYKMLLVAQCNTLSRSMPFLFEHIDDETELLLPDNLLRTDSVIAKLVAAIPEEDWQEVEIIGWLYQFYISEKKDEVIGKVVKSEDIPAATQLFTPNWIVKYLVQNSVGRLWLMANPASTLKSEWAYYIEPAEQTPEVQAQLDALIQTRMIEDGGSLSPETIKMLDPACGSGHILVEAYEVLKGIYLERGYRLRDIPRLILEKNLFGLDIDDRAAQLAGFALLMKARADDRRLFDNPPTLNVLALQESKGLDAVQLSAALVGSGQWAVGSKQQLSTDVCSLITVFEYAKTFGSLIQIPPSLNMKLATMAESLQQAIKSGDLLSESAAQQLLPLVEQAKVLGMQFDAVVANPPYMGGKGMNPVLKDYAKATFPDSKSDLFAMFIERGFGWCKPTGFNSMVTMQSWMFLSSYEAMREKLLTDRTIMTMAHLGARAFSEISGEVVQTTAFILQGKHFSGFKPVFFRLVDGLEAEKEATLLAGLNRHDLTIQDAFKKIPGSPVAYWVGKKIIDAFSKNQLIGSRAKKGITTGDNEKFLRYWFEVSIEKLSMLGGNKWFPSQKGGEFKKWYGNLEFIINWGNSGFEIKNFKTSSGALRSVIRNESYYFLEGVSWTDVSTGKISARYVPDGFLFNASGPTVFSENPMLFLANLNNVVTYKNTEFICPTIHFEVGQIQRLPFTNIDDTSHVNDLVRMARQDWNASEYSWEFEESPLAAKRGNTLKKTWDQWQIACVERVLKTKALEELNNRLFITAYGLQDELSPEVPEEQITLTRADREKDSQRLISYVIGCIMGRYSLDEPGLIYAHAGNIGFDATRCQTFPADADGIVPLTDEFWFEDDAANRIREFLLAVWGAETLNENMAWLAESLGMKGNETSEETIRRYLASSFFKNHLQTYKKRPIYWLFSSGKQGAFQALVYLHRYHEGTLARMRAEYVVPLTSKIQSRIEMLIKDAEVATVTSVRNKINKEVEVLRKKHVELLAYDEKLRHYADMRIQLDLDDGVKVNYGKFGDLLAEVKAVTGGSGDE
ncbi:BREX-1 system adenine-specific DNA-methyltransferase PglX [Gallionella capsiferriformans]|uniref:site-specific DNA-methyltransferase (adenine-specific) n=1 Tax=Gallionella capsiferriformans (strain ES-2) TaxID=395494 RepID=D9SEE3_GALCS|nr:BREX-1 system adenine-specific DNA-methyltransferase PglX [Gallionella capsiferriformans]ADL54919.1 putative restriction enzyme [Gallionella capsiferriformans ES-2]MDP1594028.1 BREX-1 system adenine-specific DNA-methyltransferase PglX [Gallionella sp.]MDP1940368.1 BREX-1 system adenine-specific DNA-methyltransferase PglX [Gallionella sp.]